MQVNKQHLEPHTEQWTGSKLGKEYVKAVYSHSVYFTSMQSTSYEILGWIIPQAGIKIAGRNINNLRYADDNLLWKILKEMGIPDHLLPEKPVCRSRGNS